MTEQSNQPRELLTNAAAGEAAAVDAFAPLVYEELRQLARRYANQVVGKPLTLQPTAIVNEAFIKLIGDPGGESSSYEGRTHFCCVAALAMRQVLIDHLRGRNRVKRGGGMVRVTLMHLADENSAEVDLLDLDAALVELADLDARAARVVELRFFGGLLEREIASFLEVSPRTVRNDWAMARAWLRQRLT